MRKMSSLIFAAANLLSVPASFAGECWITPRVMFLKYEGYMSEAHESYDRKSDILPLSDWKACFQKALGVAKKLPYETQILVPMIKSTRPNDHATYNVIGLNDLQAEHAARAVTSSETATLIVKWRFHSKDSAADIQGVVSKFTRAAAQDEDLAVDPAGAAVRMK